jgi:hypothetical protein
VLIEVEWRRKGSLLNLAISVVLGMELMTAMESELFLYVEKTLWWVEVDSEE